MAVLRSAGALLAALFALLALPAAASAAVTLDKQAPDRQLYGTDATVRLVAGNTAPYGYNLSFRDVLPAGVSYVPGSSPIAPQILANQPAAGQTTLIWHNVSDLSPNSEYALTYQVRHALGSFTPGDAYTNQAAAFVNSDPRLVPRFSATGAASNFTSQSADSATTLVTPVEIEKDEPSPEGELLRGVHDHRTVYTLRLRNNAVNPTSALVVEDYLPAGLEFLGCGAGDNTAGDAREYPGAPRLNAGGPPPGLASCLAPDLVETVVTDPDGALGPLPSAVYTHVRWNLPTPLVAGEVRELQYVAAIPIFENTATWPGATPGTGGPQGSNLDNNTGTETADEQPLTNRASVTGLYDGTSPASDDDTMTRTAEDLRVLKSVDQPTIAQGQISEWSLDIASSEYRTVNDLVVTDTVPDGLCPLGPANYDAGAAAECAPTGDAPSIPYSNVADDGSTFTLTWDELPDLGTSDGLVITFPTRTREAYQGTGQPVLARDSWTNSVSIQGDDVAPAGVPHTEVDDLPDLDVSSAGQEAGDIEIDKQVAQPVAGAIDCGTATYVDAFASFYRPGDRICWKLRVEFPLALDTGNPTVTDFLPPGMTYVPGSEVQTTGPEYLAGTIAVDDANGTVAWDVGTTVDQGGEIFEVVFASVVDGTRATPDVDIVANLLKVSYANTAARSFALRDAADVELREAQLTLDKRVKRASGTLQDAITADGAETVTYQLDLAEIGGVEAEQVEVWDTLPPEITCAAVSSISDGGVCAAGRITWTVASVAANGAEALSYDVQLPSAYAGGKTFVNSAGIRTYVSDTNVPGTFRYWPADNIDPAVPAEDENTTAADDTATVTLRSPTIAKTRTTSVTEAGNNAASQATIGETVSYTITVTLPANQTFTGPVRVTDTVAAALGVPANVVTNIGSASVSGQQITVDLGSTYATGATDQTLTITFDGKVGPSAAHGNTIGNTATFAWTDAASGGTPRTATSTNVNTSVVEPQLSMTKTDDDPDRVNPGQTLTYTVTTSNAAGRSTAHDLTVTDDVPVGLTPVVPSISGGGTWDPVARTITWTIASLAPNASAARTYQATVDEPATAGAALTNTADATASSLAGAVAGERTTYTANASDTVLLEAASVTKSVDKGTATVGTPLVYTVELTLQPDITFFDVAVLDALPDGVDFDATRSVTCVGGCGLTATQLAPVVLADGTTRLAWRVGNVASSPDARTIRVVFDAHVDDDYAGPIAPVLSGQALVNAARGGYDAADDGIEGTTDPASYSETTAPATATTTVLEPVVAIDKDVSGQPGDADARRTEPGDGYTYTITVANTGNAPAYDVVVTDQPDDDLTDVVPGQPALVTDMWTPADRAMAWRIPGPIAPGGSVTLTYTADLARAGLVDEELIPNTADVPSFWGIPEADRDANPAWDFREYTTVAEDTVTLTADLPALSVAKDAGTAADAEIGQAFPWSIVVTNTATTATATDVAVSDVLPAGWSYTAVTGATPAPDTTAGGPAWADLGDLGPGESVTLTFTATPSEAAAANPDPQVNTATATAGDRAGGDDEYTDSDTAEADVVAPELEIRKTPDGGSATAGDPTSWTIEVENTGDGLARNVEVTDTLPAGMAYAPGDATADPSTGFSETGVTGGVITWAITSLAAGDTVTITVPVTPAASVTDGTVLTNTVTATSDERQTPVTDGGDVTIGTEADVSVDKEGPDAVDAGDELEYAITVANAGPSDAQAVIVGDVLPAGVSFVSAEAPCTQAAGTITCELGTLAAGGSVELTVVVRVLPGTTGTVENTATVETTTTDGDPDNDSDTEVTPIGVASDLSVVKTGPVTVLQGQTAAFTLAVTNDGPSDATNVSISDPLPAGASFVDEGSDDRCSEAAGSVTCAVGTLLDGGSDTLTVVLRFDEVGARTNTATVSSPDVVDGNPDNDADDADIEVLPAADLAVTKTGDATVDAGGVAAYELRVRNDGPSDATGVVLTDTLPAGTSLAGTTPDGACSETDGVVTCAVGDLAAGAEAVVGLQVTVPVALGGRTLTNGVTVAGDQGDADETDNSDSAETVVGPSVDLVVAKTTAGAVAGGEITWTVTVTNDGPSEASAVTLTDPLPAGTTFVSATPAQGSCALDGATVRCALGALPTQGATQVTIVARTAANLSGRTLANTATATSPEPEVVPEDNSDTVETVIRAQPPATVDLDVTKVASDTTPELGVAFDYVVTVRNNGPATATGVTVTDALAAPLELVRATASQGECSGRRVVRCAVGTLAAGAEATVTIRVVPVRGGRIANTATADSLQGEAQDGAQGTAGVRVQQPDTRLRLSKRAGRSRVKAGRTVTFRLTLRNGPAAAADVRLCDTLPAGMSLVRAKGAKLRGGRPCWRWSFLPARAVRHMQVKVRVAKGAAAGRLVNRARVTADNAGARRARAGVRVLAGPSRGGGVTG